MAPTNLCEWDIEVQDMYLMWKEMEIYKFCLDNMQNKKQSPLLLFGTLHFARTVLTTDEAGCPNLLCHKVKGFDKDELHSVKNAIIRGEFLSTRLQGFFIELMEVFLNCGTELISGEGLDRK